MRHGILMSDEKNKYNSLLYMMIMNYATIANLNLLFEVLQVRQYSNLSWE